MKKEETKIIFKEHVPDYMSAEDMNVFMNIPFMASEARRFQEKFGKYGNLTKEENKLINYLITYADKFYSTVLKRLNIKQQLVFKKRLGSFTVRYLDKYNWNKMQREVEKNMSHAVMPREDFEDWTEQVMEVNCKGCTKAWDSCRLYDVFDNNFAPEPGDSELCNCKYSYEGVNREVEYRAMLEKLEWSVIANFGNDLRCPSCSALKTGGHKADCKLARMLK